MLKVILRFFGALFSGLLIGGAIMQRLWEHEWHGSGLCLFFGIAIGVLTLTITAACEDGDLV